MSDNSVHFGANAEVNGGIFGGEHHTTMGGSPPRPAPYGLTTRLGFAVDLVGYTRRLPVHGGHLQERLLRVVSDTLRDIRLEGESDPGAGDDKMVLLPVGTDPTTALPALLTALPARLAFDNSRFTDPVRMRLAVASNLADRGPNGFVGRLPSELGRLLGAPVLHAAAAAKPWAGVVALVSNALHDAVVGGGYTPALADHFTQVDVDVKDLHTTAWLWPRN